MSGISDAVCARVRQWAGNRCGYCQSPQHLVFGWLEIEHVIPTSRGGTDDEANLWLACRFCNNHKYGKRESIDPQTGNVVPLFHPRKDRWRDHFAWSADGTLVIGLTPTGRATLGALHLNREGVVNLRRLLFQIGQHPPPDTTHAGNGTS